jgi:Rad3-related DNA helicase
MEYLPPPAVLGLPAKFTTWRKNQAEAVHKAVHNDRRVMISICPTGFGKSLMYVAASRLLGGKTIILTSTKGLQSQLMRDFEEIGMVDMRGKNAYRCALSDNTLSCEEGPCTLGFSCAYKRTTGCQYYAALARAQKSNLVVTNYAFWFHSNAYSDGIGSPNLLVCDEGHDAPEAVASFLTVEFNRRDDDLMQILPSFPDKLTIEEWKRWAVTNYDNMSEEVADLVEQGQEGGAKHFKRLIRMRRTLQQLKQLAIMDVDNWVCNPTATTIEFAPIQVRDRCQQLLFEKSRHAILTSASICQKTGEMLGLSSEDCLLDEYPHTFPVENRLVVHVQGARMNAKSSGEDLKEWLKTIDRIIEGRLDRKGIIHTTSYMRRDFVMAHSKYAHLMMSHQRKDVVEMVRKFKNSEPPRVFVSPAVTTGWDFPMDECEYNIIGKVPFPDTRNVITRARSEADLDYAPYIAMQQLVQSCGRGNRSEDDQCENFIIDDNITWFLRQYRKFAPKWFMESLTSRMFPPEAPTKLNRLTI